MTELAKTGVGRGHGDGDLARAPAVTGSRRRRPVVLQVVPALETGGVERGTVDIAAALEAAGATALVASGGGAMLRELERAGARHLLLPVGSKNPVIMRRNVARLAQVIADNDVDIVHARSRAPAWSALAAARRTGRPFVTTFHGTYGHGTPVKRWYNAVMTRGDAVIAISQFIADHIRTTYGVSGERVRVIHRGVDTQMFDPRNVSPERVIQLAESWRLTDDTAVVTLPGRLTRWKGQPLLIEALARLGRQDIRCLLVGSDQGRLRYRESLDRLIKSRGLESIVLIADHCNDMPAAYMLSDVVVSASTDPEAFGRVAAEGQAMGRPVVASDHGAARETVMHGRTGWLFPAGDADALADAVAEALALDPDQRGKLAAAARAHVCARFTKEKMCTETLALYDDLLSGRIGAPAPGMAMPGAG